MRYSGSLMWALRILGVGVRGKSGKRRHIISSILVIACSVIPMVLAIYLADGMTTGITGKYIRLSSFHAQLAADPEEGGLPADLPGVTGVYPVRETFCLFYSQKGSYTSNLKGVPREYLASPGVTDELEVLSGDLDIFSGPDIVLSSEIAEALQVDIDDTVAVVTVTQQSGQARIKPSILHVKGIIESGYKDLDAYLAYIDIEQARKVMKDDDAEYLGIFANQDMAEYPDQLRTILEPYGAVTTWDMLNRSLYANFKTSKLILYVIMVLIIIIATFNISSTCIMLIQEKYVDIGLMKSIGIRKQTIAYTFRIISVFIGLAGAVIGIIIGVLLSLQLNSILGGLQQLGVSALDFYLIELPQVISWPDILFTGVLTVLLSAVSSFIPVRRLNSILPIHLLHE